MEQTIVSIAQLLQQGTWHYMPFSQKVQKAREYIESLNYPRIALRELAVHATRGYAKVDKSLDEGIPVLSTQFFTGVDKDLSENPRFISPEDHEKWKKSEVRSGDILINLFVDTRRDIAAIYDMETPSNITSLLVLLRLDETRLLPEYLVAFLNWSIAKTLLTQYFPASYHTRLPLNFLLDFEIPTPDLKEQSDIMRRYAEKYDEWEKSEAETQEKLNSLDNPFE